MKKCNLYKIFANDGLKWKNKIHVVDPIQFGESFDGNDDNDDIYVELYQIV